MNNKGILAGLVVVAAAAIIGVVIATSNKDDTKSTDIGTSNSSSQDRSTDAKSADTSEAASTASVEISNFAFSPATIKVKVGGTVTWTNRDSVGHTVTSSEDDTNTMKLDSKLLQKGETFTATFTEPGTYKYHCTPHPHMMGTVIVE